MAEAIVDMYMDELTTLYPDTLVIGIDTDKDGEHIKVVVRVKKPTIVFHGCRVVCVESEY